MSKKNRRQASVKKSYRQPARPAARTRAETARSRPDAAQAGRPGRPADPGKNPKRLPKNQQEVNVGQLLSDELCKIEADSRSREAAAILGKLLNGYKASTLTHMEILFTKNLEIDLSELEKLSGGRKPGWPIMLI